MMISPIQISPLTFLDPNAPAREAQAVTLTKHVKSIPGLANNYASAVARYAAAKDEIARLDEQSGAVPQRSVRLTINNATSPHYPELLSEIEEMVNRRIGFLRVEALGILAQRVRDTYAALMETDTQARLAGELPGTDTGPIPPLPDGVSSGGGLQSQLLREPASDLACSPEPGSGIAGSHFGGGL